MKDAPRTLANPEMRQQRFDMLKLPHIAPLTEYVHKLRAEGFGDVPYFDPKDGGTKASRLFLLEKPGPMASSSGFISRDNDDPTAENTYNFMKKARIARATTCLWNTIPGWNDTTDFTRAESKRGSACLPRLLALLPNLTVVVLVGTEAKKWAAPHVKAANIPVLTSYHPSRTNQNCNPELWASIPDDWGKVHNPPTRSRPPLDLYPPQIVR